LVSSEIRFLLNHLIVVVVPTRAGLGVVSGLKCSDDVLSLIEFSPLLLHVLYVLFPVRLLWLVPQKSMADRIATDAAARPLTAPSTKMAGT